MPRILRCCMVRLLSPYMTINFSLLNQRLSSSSLFVKSSLLLEFWLCNLYSVRVSNELGRGNSKAAKFAIKVVLSISIGIGVIFFALHLAFGKQISYIFTSNEEIAESVSNLSTLLAFSILLNSVQPLLSGNTFISLL
jgi:MATE family multidrug resistance protein